MAALAGIGCHRVGGAPDPSCAVRPPAGEAVPVDLTGAAAHAWASRVLVHAGLGVTRPRILVLLGLRDRARPVTAQQLHAELRTGLGRGGERIKAPGLTSVYRVLAVLAEHAVVHWFHQESLATTAYRLCTADAHIHLICRCCRSVQEHPVPWAAELATSVRGDSGVADGFAVESVRAEVLGLCAACRISPPTDAGAPAWHLGA